MKFKSQERSLRAFHPPKTIPRAAKPGRQRGPVPACCPVLSCPGTSPAVKAWVKEAVEVVRGDNVPGEAVTGGKG